MATTDQTVKRMSSAATCLIRLVFTILTLSARTVLATDITNSSVSTFDDVDWASECDGWSDDWMNNWNDDLAQVYLEKCSSIAVEPNTDDIDWDSECEGWSNDWLEGWDDDLATLYNIRCNIPPSEMPSPTPQPVPILMPHPSTLPTWKSDKFDFSKCDKLGDDLLDGDDDLRVKCGSRPTQNSFQVSTSSPTGSPTVSLTESPTVLLTEWSTESPTGSPTHAPSRKVSSLPTITESHAPSLYLSRSPTILRSMPPTVNLSNLPTLKHSNLPSLTTSNTPSTKPTYLPTIQHTVSPSNKPTITSMPSMKYIPSAGPTLSSSPSVSPSESPVDTPSTTPTVGTGQATPDPTVEKAAVEIPPFEMRIETTEIGFYDEEELIGVTITFLTYQYLILLDKKHGLNSISLSLVLPASRRLKRSLEISKTTMEGIAYFDSLPVPTREEMVRLTENSFSDESPQGTVVFMELLKSSQDPILTTVESVTIEIADGNGPITITDTSSNMNDGQSTGDGSTGGGGNGGSMIPIVAGIVSSFFFLIGAVVLARKSNSRAQPKYDSATVAQHVSASPSATKRDLPRSDIGGELQFEDESERDDNDSYSMASQSYAYSMSYPPSHLGASSSFGGAGSNILGSYESNSDDESSVTEISLDESRFNTILQQGEKKNKSDFKSVWKDAQTPSTKLKSSRKKKPDRQVFTDHLADMEQCSDLGSDFGTSISNIGHSVQ